MCLLKGCHLLPGIVETSVVEDRENWKITFSSKGDGANKADEDSEEEDKPSGEAEECHHSQANITMQITRIKDSEELCVEFTHGRKVSMASF